MEPKFQTSFIPKNPITPTSANPVPRASSFNFLPTVGAFVFVIAVVAYGALWGYEKVLNSKITELDKSLVLAKSAFDPVTIQQLITASDQIDSAKNILNDHIAVSNMFALLELNILPNVRFTSFNFQEAGDGTITVSIDGEAQSYAALAEQSNLLSKISYLKNQNFTNLDLSDKGTVTLKFKSDLDPNLISYVQALKNASLENSSQTSIDTSTTIDTTTPPTP